jgi:catechol 2,3-dioxygenase-like lactoylglutathione lyase family enzyme
MAKIRHLAIYTEDPDRLAAFYVEVFGLVKTQDSPSQPGTGRAVWLTDGYLDIALIQPHDAKTPKGVNHFGFTLEPGEQASVYAKLKQHGREPYRPPPGRPYIEDAARDVDGNKFDLSTTGLRSEDEQVERDKAQRDLAEV